MQRYMLFSGLFFVIHTVCYYVAGIFNYQISRRLYGGKDQLYRSFLRNMSDPREASSVNLRIIPAQLVRSIFMSAVLFPILVPLANLSFGVRALFMGGLMFVYADFCSAIPFSNTVEGLVYMRPEFVRPRIFWTIQSEAVLYSLLFGLTSSYFLF